MMVDEHLKQVFDAHALVLAQLVVLELLLREFAVMRLIIDQGLYYIFQNTDHLIIKRSRVSCLFDVVRCVVAILVSELLFFRLFEQFRPVNLENLNLFLDIEDVFLDDL